MGLAAIATTTWLAVNLNSERAARRMVVLQEERGPYTKFARGYANEALGIYYRQRDPRQAREAYTRAVAANPANPRYFNNLGNVELQLQNLPAARESFARAAALGMRTDFLLYNLAVTEAELGNRAAAESVFVEVVERWPRNWRGIMGLAQIRIQSGRAAEALPLVDRAETLVPASSKADVLYLRGLALRDLGRRADARTTFEAALRLEPGHVHSQKALEKLAAAP
jgi:tetratricopeptide (TPR) repeat protein